MNMKKALVLAGGGTKGAYQAGAWKALMELGKEEFDIVTGTSVGALNGILIVQKDYDELFSLYENLSVEQIINGLSPAEIDLKTAFRNREDLTKEVLQYIKERGLDISPFVSNLDKMYHAEKFHTSNVDFGCIVATHHGHSPVYVTKDMMKENGLDWLVASASAYPAFPIKEIDGSQYVDGGYFDNCPVDFALRMGADEVLVLDLNPSPNHPQYIKRRNIHYVFPKSDTGDFLDFSKERLHSLFQRGYNDILKLYGTYVGYQYTFEPFEIPDWFDVWFRDMELLETDIKLAGNINEALRSDTYVTDILKSRMHLPYLQDEDYFYGMLDALMRMLGAKEEEVYEIQDIQRQLKDQFAEYMQEGFSYKALTSLAKIPLIPNQSNVRAIVGRLLHEKLYPDHTIVSNATILTVYPFEKALADFLSYFLREEQV